MCRLQGATLSYCESSREAGMDRLRRSAAYPPASAWRDERVRFYTPVQRRANPLRGIIGARRA
jgi:hypothetical protein